jgi:DNA topoisomerase-1
VGKGLVRLWETLQHSGVAFPAPYESKGLTVSVAGKVIQPSLLAEEMLYAIAKKRGTPYVEDTVFTANFMKSLSEADSQFKGLSYSDLDLSRFYSYIDAEKNSKSSISKEDRKKALTSRKKQKEALRAKYGTMILDGKKVRIRNFVVEPPSLFMGRGKHPLRGTWKPALTEKDITLNLGEDAVVPPGQWKVVHDHTGIWIAKWQNQLDKKTKYVWAEEGAVKVDNSRKKEKFDKAVKIGEHIDKIRAAIAKAMTAKSEEERQIGTACYLIDQLGFRVGNEKGEGEADTVGCTTLRVEHVHIDSKIISFDFLGKDSVPWHKEFPIEPTLVSNLTEFMKGKKPSDLVFDKIDSGSVNRFFKTVGNITAKVFRTYHATRIMKDGLYSKDVSNAETLQKIAHARDANLQVAIFLNHKKTVPTTFAERLKKKEARYERLLKKGTERAKARAEWVKFGIDFSKRSMEYNLGTSLNSYVDPRVVKEWCEKVGLDWAKLYTKSQLKKFAWVK